MRRCWHRKTAAGRRDPVGFTLIELLVVVSIIALLVAILLPSMQRAIATARTTVCQSRMRQLMLASITYSSDSFGILPNPNWGVFEPCRGWLYDYNKPADPRPQSGVLYPILHDLKVYHCPSHPKPWTYGTQKYTSYTMNGSVVGYGHAGSMYKLSDYQEEDVIFWETDENSPFWNDGANFPHEFATGRHPLGGDLGAGNVAAIDGSVTWISTKAYHDLAFPAFPVNRNKLWNRPYTTCGW